MKVQNIEKSNDGTIKFIFEHGFHCVLIPQKGNKKTLCISSQIGCSMGCEFCLTAKMGFLRNLSFEEIISQFKEALNYLNSKKLFTRKESKGEIYAHEVITSIVFMGMGEPLNNYKNVARSIEYLNYFYSYPFKKITVSTSGIVPKMKEFIKMDWKVHLALSFHSPFQEIRNKLMPYLFKWSIEELVEVCNEYSRKFRNKIMIEYIMIDGLTNRDCDLKKLLDLGFDKMTNFNLIPLNGFMELDGKKYFASSNEICNKFRLTLMNNGYKCFIRYNMGEDIQAACGMLSRESE